MDILLKSIIGGCVIASVLLLSKFMGTKVAGIIAVIPAAFTVSYILVTSIKQDTIEIHNFLQGSFIGMIIFILFILFLLFTNGKTGYWTNLILAYLLWFTCAGTYLYLTKK